MGTYLAGLLGLAGVVLVIVGVKRRGATLFESVTGQVAPVTIPPGADIWRQGDGVPAPPVDTGPAMPEPTGPMIPGLPPIPGMPYPTLVR